MKNAYIGSTVSNPHSFPAAVSKPRPPAPRIRGLGDIVHAALKALGVVWLVDRTSKATGKPCGCAERRRKLNEAFPTSYPQAESPKPSKVDEPPEPI